MTVKARDPGGTLRTVTSIKVRDAAGTLRSIAFVRMRDAAGVLREVFSSGGGGASNPASITPGTISLTGSGYARSATFSAVSSGGTPTSYLWGLLDGSGSVLSGGNSAVATLQVYATPGEPTASQFFCDMVIGGVTYRATCRFLYRAS